MLTKRKKRNIVEIKNLALPRAKKQKKQKDNFVSTPTTRSNISQGIKKN